MLGILRSLRHRVRLSTIISGGIGLLSDASSLDAHHALPPSSIFPPSNPAQHRTSLLSIASSTTLADDDQALPSPLRSEAPKLGSVPVEEPPSEPQIGAHSGAKHVLTGPELLFRLQSGGGINWNHANQGLLLLNQAARESYGRLPIKEDDADVLSRQLYVHALTYLVRALPPELSTHELAGVEAALHATGHFHAPLAASAPAPPRGGSAAASDARPSSLHRLTAATVVHMCLLLRVLVPFVQQLVAQAYEYERRHRLTERVVLFGVDTLEDAGRRSMQLSHALLHIHSSWLGRKIRAAVAHTAGAVLAGVHQGFAEGLRPQSSEKG